MTAWLVGIGLTAGCERSEEKKSESAQTVESTEKSSPAHEKQKAEVPDGWAVVSADALSPDASHRLKRARAAQMDLGKTLLGALTESVDEKGFAASVEFCHGEAQKIADKIARKHNVRIGRTSFKLRNPDNAPPEWARDFVDKRVDEARVLEGPEGQVGWFKPIHLGGMCTNCHGDKETLAEGVPEKLAEHYPEDRATGFEAGDLRGWFWVEVPAS